MSSYADSIGYSAIMMLYDGQLMYAWGDTEKTATAEELLQSRSGVYHEAAASTNTNSTSRCIRLTTCA